MKVELLLICYKVVIILVLWEVLSIYLYKVMLQLLWLNFEGVDGI